jgi:hypothetical protein
VSVLANKSVRYERRMTVKRLTCFTFGVLFASMLVSCATPTSFPPTATPISILLTATPTMARPTPTPTLNTPARDEVGGTTASAADTVGEGQDVSSAEDEGSGGSVPQVETQYRVISAELWSGPIGGLEFQLPDGSWVPIECPVEPAACRDALYVHGVVEQWIDGESLGEGEFYSLEFHVPVGTKVVAVYDGGISGPWNLARDYVGGEIIPGRFNDGAYDFFPPRRLGGVQRLDVLRTFPGDV